MRDPARRVELFEGLDPFAMDGRVQQRREPHRPGDVGALAHHLAQAIVRNRAKLDRSCSNQRMIEPSERKTVEIDEVARQVYPDDIAPLVGLDRAEHEAF